MGWEAIGLIVLFIVAIAAINRDRVRPLRLMASPRLGAGHRRGAADRPRAGPDRGAGRLRRRRPPPPLAAPATRSRRSRRWAARRAPPRPTSPTRRPAARWPARGEPLTLLVNCASLFEDDRISSLTAAGWDAAMAANLRAPVLLAQAFANALPADAGGLIVNIIDQRVLRPDAAVLQLCGEQGGALGGDPDAGAGPGAAHPRQRHRAGPDTALDPSVAGRPSTPSARRCCSATGRRRRRSARRSPTSLTRPR